MHRWAVVLGATLVCMLLGFSGSSSWPRADIVFKAILNVIAVAGFVLLAEGSVEQSQFVNSSAFGRNLRTCQVINPLTSYFCQWDFIAPAATNVRSSLSFVSFIAT